MVPSDHKAPRDFQCWGRFSSNRDYNYDDMTVMRLMDLNNSNPITGKRASLYGDSSQMASVCWAQHR